MRLESGTSLDPVMLMSFVIGMQLLQSHFYVCCIHMCRTQITDMLAAVLSDSEVYLCELAGSNI
jgi:hypothetical protein